MLLPKYQHLQEPDRYIVLLEDIQDIHPYYITLPQPPKPEKIINFNLPKEQQFFKKITIPPAIRRLNLLSRNEAKSIAQKNADIYKFVQMCWQKREEGEWQYINGKPYYFPGNYWWYLNFYYLPHGSLPEFRVYNLKYFWFRNFVVWNNPSVWGSLMFTTRQVGKSSMAGGELLEYVTKTPNAHCGAISKDETSAKEFFRKYIVNPRKKLLWFFQPIFDGNLSPKEEINFTYPTKKGADASDFNFDEEPLESKIDIKALTTAAYDSETLRSIVVDEPGKYANVSVIQLWDRLKYSLRAFNGKANFITTIEELDRNGGMEFKLLWDNSNTAQLNELGETISGLVPYFIPSYEALITDAYGESIVDKPTPQQQEYLYQYYSKKGYAENIAYKLSHIGAKEKIELEKQEIKDSWQRIAYTRKHPITIREGFISSFKNCHFNLSKIESQLEKFVFGSPYTLRRGNFEWKDNKPDTEVIFREDDNGKWFVSFLLKQEKANKWRLIGNQRHPEECGNYTGIDPYRFSKSLNGSMGASYTWTEFDTQIDDENEDSSYWLTDDFTIEYINRPLGIEEFFEDMILQCVYTNSKAYVERNATEAIFNHFVERGYAGYLKHDLKAKKSKNRIIIEEKATPGVYNAGDNVLKNKMFNEINWYVNYCIQRCKFTRLLNQFKEAQYEDLQPYDAFVAAALARINANMISKKPNINLRPSVKKEKTPDFPIYKPSIF